jgi:comEA protein
MLPITKQERLVMFILLAVIVGGGMLQLALTLCPWSYQALYFLDSANLQPKVDLNTATLTELQNIPGIGPVTAAKIIEYRDRTKGFSAPEELRNVSGIGPAKFKKIAPMIKIVPP